MTTTSADPDLLLASGGVGLASVAGGWAFWTGLWAGEISAEAVASGVLHSAEFQARHGTPDAAGLVPLLLRETLGHTPSDAEAAPWLEAVRAGLDTPGLLVAMAEDLALTAHYVPVMGGGLLCSLSAPPIPARLRAAAGAAAGAGR
ncbi:MAG: hypothetical protein IRY87_29480 [Acetobacteraceae bacterium]|nr:hypothetical protein [Acetobacteraceae bacterium]